jgi:Xaa-Pro dipeptidase
MRSVCRPGLAVGGVFDAYAEVLREAGLENLGLERCGHGAGAVYAPSAADWPFIEAGCEVRIEAGMSFYLQAAVRDFETRAALVLGETVVVGEAGAARASAPPHASSQISSMARP